MVFLFGEEFGSEPHWISTTSHIPNQPPAAPEESGHTKSALLVNTPATAKGPLHNRHWNTLKKKEGGLQLSSTIKNLRQYQTVLLFLKMALFNVKPNNWFIRPLKGILSMPKNISWTVCFTLWVNLLFLRQRQLSWVQTLYPETLAQVFTKNLSNYLYFN